MDTKSAHIVNLTSNFINNMRYYHVVSNFFGQVNYINTQLISKRISRSGRTDFNKAYKLAKKGVMMPEKDKTEPFSWFHRNVTTNTEKVKTNKTTTKKLTIEE